MSLKSTRFSFQHLSGGKDISLGIDLGQSNFCWSDPQLNDFSSLESPSSIAEKVKLNPQPCKVESMMLCLLVPSRNSRKKGRKGIQALTLERHLFSV